MKCVQCEATLTRDDIGLHKKLVDRAAEKDFMCKACQAKYFNVDIALLDKKIEDFKFQGCLLFC
ncbi:MAG: hypothetical protein IIW23_00125 [Clostridia bacterium]|nr:hypothetical protein [Clostridia bacterium]